MSKGHRVVVTGIGCVSPYGIGANRLFDGIKSGKSALSFNSTLKTVLGSVPERSAEKPYGFDISKFDNRDQRLLTRATMFALIAAEEALRDANALESDAEFHLDTGVNIGMGICELNEVYETGKLIAEGSPRRVSPFFVPRILTNIPAGYVTNRFGLKGGTASTTTACATGASCIGDAFSMIQSGRIRRVLAGSVESSLVEMAVVGFQRMRALASGDNVSISRPFDSKREGFVLSEGCGVLMLERLEDAKKRGAKCYAEILGYGVSSDAYHLTAPSPDGLASELCIRRCLNDGNIEIKEVGYVNAHATSTPIGDSAEAISIGRLLPNVPLSSLKGHIGHCVSAAGSVETIASILCLQNSTIPPTLNLQQTDIQADVDLIRNDFRLWPSDKRRIFVKNSFGFGGSFVSLAFGEL